jgi:hypothetical protein
MPYSTQAKRSQIRNITAFKWAVLLAIKNEIGYSILEDKNTVKPKLYYSEFSESDRTSFVNSATVAVKHIVKKESKFFAIKGGTIRLQSARAGQAGDVRDLVISNGVKEIGLSCKSTRSDLKQSRLSDVLDFALEWGLDPSGCSTEYWKSVDGIFSPIKKLAAANTNAQWKDVVNKEKIYCEILDAWKQEIWRCYGKTATENEEFCKKLITYLFGAHDCYKVIKHGETAVDVQFINLSKNLSKPFAKYPTAMRAIDNLDGDPYSKTIAFNNGFSINFRIHNADKKLNTSLKFAINAISLPAGQFYQQTLEV